MHTTQYGNRLQINFYLEKVLPKLPTSYTYPKKKERRAGLGQLPKSSNIDLWSNLYPLRSFWCYRDGYYIAKSNSSLDTIIYTLCNWQKMTFHANL